MVNVIQYDNSQRGPSPGLWRGQEPLVGEYFLNPNKGWGFHDEMFYLEATGNKNVLVEGDGTVTWATLVGEKTGVTRCAITGTDNAEGYLQFGDALTAPLVIDAAVGEVFFEARIRSSSVTDDVNGLFIGIAGEGAAAGDFIADGGGDVADVDVLGFFVKNDDGDSVDTIFQTTGSAFTTVQAGAATMVAATWIKLGFHFDGISAVDFYVNGVKTATSTTEGATDFPTAEEMSPILGVKVSSNVALNADIDWWAFAQEAV